MESGFSSMVVSAVAIVCVHVLFPEGVGRTYSSEDTETGPQAHNLDKDWPHSTSITSNKEKERMKAREKETKERESRYSNGHLFTSLSVSSTTLCSACNKSITAKEALSCPTTEAGPGQEHCRIIKCGPPEQKSNTEGEAKFSHIPFRNAEAVLSWFSQRTLFTLSQQECLHQ
ncbi:hypothetical protein DNTS_009894 [Danionella cerebrum]|uniref:Uncharacterized protein n=1 Tax=Danionella cerebrum TaxID=2873325 RepID=A0A553NJ31_9TELE|nr:hypothetical protein DNTS_009894 [Danionella translucida]